MKATIRIYNSTEKTYANEKITKFMNVSNMHCEWIHPRVAYINGISNLDPNNEYYVLTDIFGREYLYRKAYCDITVA